MSSVNRRHEVGPGKNRAVKAISNNRKKKKTTVGVVFTDLYKPATAETLAKAGGDICFHNPIPEAKISILNEHFTYRNLSICNLSAIQRSNRKSNIYRYLVTWVLLSSREDE